MGMVRVDSEAMPVVPCKVVTSRLDGIKSTVGFGFRGEDYFPFEGDDL